MPIRFACPSCRAVASAPDDKGGRTANCPNCGAEVRVPALGKLVRPSKAPPPVAATPAQVRDPDPPGVPAWVAEAKAPEPPPPAAPPKSDFITLGCPSCGGNLQITTDAERFACKYCGREHLVRRDHGVITVTPILEKLDRMISASDRQASELAIPRLKRECHEIEDQIAKAWRYIDNWKDWHSAKSGQTITHALVIGFVGLSFSACLGIAHWSFFIMGAVFTAGVCTLVVCYWRPNADHVRRRVRKARERIEELEDDLRSCRRELRKHYDNVRI